uniref:Uncharacterized protein n=1 Tax=Nothoprocta perdicaria TaxID=30464 RepID=A0A8C6ZSV4_NOTPE
PNSGKLLFTSACISLFSPEISFYYSFPVLLLIWSKLLPIIWHTLLLIVDFHFCLMKKNEAWRALKHRVYPECAGFC